METEVTKNIIGSSLPEHTLKVFDPQKNDIVDKKLSEFKGKWLVLFFYPADFTFVCPTELEELADLYEEFKKIDVEVLSLSTDTAFTHKAWHEKSPAISKVKYPMGADTNAFLAKTLGVYIAEEGLSQRGTFIINPEGVIVAQEVNDNSIGRSAKELLRKIRAAQYVASHDGQVCPASWQPGDDTLTPGADMVGKI